MPLNFQNFVIWESLCQWNAKISQFDRSAKILSYIEILDMIMHKTRKIMTQDFQSREILRKLSWRQYLLSPFLRYCCSKVDRYYNPHSGSQEAKALKKNLWNLPYCMHYNFHNQNIYYSVNFVPDLNIFLEHEHNLVHIIKIFIIP